VGKKLKWELADGGGEVRRGEGKKGERRRGRERREAEMEYKRERK
jgi:hypothetical protein